MELTAQLPVLLGMLMLAAMLALSIERFGADRKLRNDDRRYQQRMRRNHGEARRPRQDPPKP
jgi:chromosome condensin MukBEF MukE localization factor